MRLLVTGATGMIGSAVCDALRARGELPMPLLDGGLDLVGVRDLAANDLDEHGRPPSLVSRTLRSTNREK